MFYDKYVLLCKEAGLSTSAAATRAGINKGTVSVWKKRREQGIDVDPDKTTIEKLCAFFRVSEAELRGVSFPNEKKSPDTVDGGDLDAELVARLMQLSEADREKVSAFVQGLLAGR